MRVVRRRCSSRKLSCRSFTAARRDHTAFRDEAKQAVGAGAGGRRAGDGSAEHTLHAYCHHIAAVFLAIDGGAAGFGGSEMALKLRGTPAGAR